MKVVNRNLERFRSVLFYLDTYPEVISILKISSLVKPENLNNHYLEWVRLVNSFTGLERRHFKTVWLPVEEAGFDFFVDLSDENLPLFQCNYMFYEPYSYFNTVLFSSMQEFLLCIENGTDFNEIAFSHFLNVCNDFISNHHMAEAKPPHDNSGL